MPAWLKRSGNHRRNNLILNAAGGECLDDFAHLRQDGVRELIGHDLPSPEAARKFLYQFHDEPLIEQAQQRLLPGQVSSIKWQVSTNGGYEPRRRTDGREIYFLLTPGAPENQRAPPAGRGRGR